MTREALQRDDLGLSIDMLDADRLREWARLLLVHGADIGHWGSVPFVASKLQTLATDIEKAVRDIGTLRALATPPADPYGAFVADVREAAEQAGWDGATNLRAWVIARLKATPPAGEGRHRCSGCGHRWDGLLKGAELCGDCWRTAQPVLHAGDDPTDCPGCGTSKALCLEYRIRGQACCPDCKHRPAPPAGETPQVEAHCGNCLGTRFEVVDAQDGLKAERCMTCGEQELLAHAKSSR